jgi:hypothetical protein
LSEVKCVAKMGNNKEVGGCIVTNTDNSDHIVFWETMDFYFYLMQVHWTNPVGRPIFTVAQNYTFCSWVQWTDRSESRAYILWWGNAGDAIMLNGNNNNNYPLRELGIRSGRRPEDAGDKLFDRTFHSSGFKIDATTVGNKWTFICGVGKGSTASGAEPYDGTMSFYLGLHDEETGPVQVGTPVNYVLSGTSPKYIGGAIDQLKITHTVGNSRVGKLAMFRFWNTALSLDQMSHEFETTKTAIESDPCDWNCFRDNNWGGNYWNRHNWDNAKAEEAYNGKNNWGIMKNYQYCRDCTCSYLGSNGVIGEQETWEHRRRR